MAEGVRCLKVNGKGLTLGQSVDDGSGEMSTKCVLVRKWCGGYAKVLGQVIHWFSVKHTVT